MRPSTRTWIPLALTALLLPAGCGDPPAELPQVDDSPPARSVVQLDENAVAAIETLPGYWICEVRHVLNDDSQQPAFRYLQRVTDLGQVYQYQLDGLPEPGKEPLSHEYFCLSANGGAIETPNHWVFREASVLVFDELPAEASAKAWESFQNGEAYEIAPDCWLRRKYLVHNVADDRLLLMQPPRMAGWFGSKEEYEELGIQGTVVEMSRLSEPEFQELRKVRHDPHHG